MWDGGLGDMGGIPLGVLAGAFVVRRSGNSVTLMMDAVAPGLLLAQGIGRWGNYWNQELYGRPTTLPWGLQDRSGAPERDPARYQGHAAYQPTFLYEFIWDLIGVGVLLWVDRRFTIRRPALFALYVAGTRPSARSRRSCGSTRPTTSSACGSTSGSRSWSGRLGRFLHLVAVLPRAVGDEAEAAEAAADPDRPAHGRPEGPRPVTALASARVIVRELELDLDAFEGPFDLLLALVLKEELDLRDVDLAGIVTAFLERLAEREELDLEACGEFLVLIAALLELKARALFPDEEAELAELEPEEAAEELARRLAEYRRAKEAAAWLRERLAAEGDRYFRLGPAPLAPKVETPLAPQDPEALARVLRLLAQEPPAGLALAHGAALPARLAVPRAVPRAAPPAHEVRLRDRGWRDDAARAGVGLPRAARAPPRGRARDRAGRAVRADPRQPLAEEKPVQEERTAAWTAPLRLIPR